MSGDRVGYIAQWAESLDWKLAALIARVERIEDTLDFLVEKLGPSQEFQDIARAIIEGTEYRPSAGLVITQVLVAPYPPHMTAVFDQHSRQMPEYQGQWDDVKAKIRANFDGEIEFVGGPELP